MIKIIKHPNGIKAKLKDRRIFAFENDDHSTTVRFIKRTNDLEPHAGHFVIRDKVVVTEIRLSEEAAQALMLTLTEHFRDTTFKPFDKDVV